MIACINWKYTNGKCLIPQEKFLDMPVLDRFFWHKVRIYFEKCWCCFPTISGIGCDSISSVAVCAGSGGGLLKNLNVSLYVTGEMSHHDVLHAAQSGVSVILCDHSNTERGFLKVLQESLTKVFQNEIDIQVSKSDKDPLDVVWHLLFLLFA